MRMASTLAFVSALTLGCSSERAPDEGEQASVPDVQFRCAPKDLPGVGGLETVELSGAATIVGLDVDFDLFSNGTLSLSGLANVAGGLVADPNSILLSLTAIFNGEVSDWAPDIPVYIPTEEADYISANRHNDDIGLTTAGRDPLGGADTMQLFGADTLQVPGWFYYLDGIGISGASTLSLSYTITYLVVDGPVEISGGSTLGTSNARHLLLISLSDEPIVISGTGTNVIARIYAPLAPVQITDGATVQGAVVAKTLQMSGTSNMEVTADGLHIWYPC